MSDDTTRHPVSTTDLAPALRAWRAAHPDATFTEIEAELERRWRTVRAALLAEVAEADAAAPRCPTCDAALVRRGMRTRTLTTQGDEPVALTRAYTTCPACGTGLFPPR